MFFFWIVVGLITAAATASLVLPLLRAAHRVAPEARNDEARRLAVYRDRRAEIEAERHAGRLTPAEAERALDELVEDAAVQLEHDGSAADPGEDPALPAGGAAPSGAGARGRLIAVAIGIAIAVPVATLLGYGWLGAPALVAMSPDAPGVDSSGRHATEIVGELSARVARNPNDAEAWALLGQAHSIKGDIAAAVAAYGRAAELLPGDARLLADYAEVLAQSQGGDLRGRPTELLTRALAANPNESKAIALMGAALYRSGELPQALVYMRQLAGGLPPGSEPAQQIAEVIARIESQIAGGGAPKGPGAPGGPGPRAAAPVAPGAPGAAPRGPFAAGAQAPSPAAADAVVSGSIEISADLAGKIAPGAALFVIARAPEGPPIPYAAVKLSPSGWPLRFSLGDAQAMNPARLLSGADAIVIEARVSMDGNPARRSGDLFGRSATVKPGAKGLAIRIDQRVP
ncbi:MAG TPA: c-type cytochrome biogenesis protein CcmI [Burkholderiaceae bacterium]